LDKIDWSIVAEKYWSNKADDFDRMRRKQAEFLVKEHVPVNCIYKVAVFNIEAKEYIEQQIKDLSLSITLEVNPQLYYT